MKTFFYIFKRILIGTGIAFLLGLIRGKLLLNTYALQVSSYNLGQSPTFVISNQDTSVSFGVTGSPYSVHAGTSGYINFNFSVFKVSGTATAPLVMPRGASVSFGTGNVSTNFICDIGSVSSNNSTFNSQVYTAHCPVTANSNGLTQIYIAFQDFQANDNSTYRVIINSGISYEIIDNTNVNVDISGTTNAINNQITNDNTNTQNIINNQNTNTQDIIDNQNTNTQDIIDNQNKNTRDLIGGICQESSSFFNFDLTGKFFNSSTGELADNSAWSATSDYYTGIDKIIIVTQGANTQALRINNYDSNKNYISTSSYSGNQEIVLNKKNFYKVARRSPTLISYTVYVCTSGLSDINSSITDVNSTLNDDNVSSANTQASDFFNNFQHDSHGLSGIITAPLRLINALTTAQCTPLQFQLPFIHNQVTLPCMRGIYENYFGVFFSLYQLITTGLICYNVMINLYSKIHNLQNPKNDRIEVLNL